MIVISGALVVVAIVLLLIGLISGALGFVYASIAGSVVAFVFLIVGVMQRRGEEAPALATGAPALAGSSDAEGLTAIIPAGTRPLPSDADRVAPAAATAAVSGSVLVVEGRPRYHVSGCRYLTGKDANAVPVDRARADGFTACGVCKPDEALSAAPAAPAAADVVEAAGRPIRKAPARTAAKAPAVTKAAATQAGAAARKAAPAKAAPAKAAPVKAAPAKSATRTAAKSTAKQAPAKTAAPKAAPAKTPAKTAAKKATGTAARTAGKAVTKTAGKTVAKKAPAKKAAARR